MFSPSLLLNFILMVYNSMADFLAIYSSYIFSYLLLLYTNSVVFIELYSSNLSCCAYPSSFTPFCFNILKDYS